MIKFILLSFLLLSFSGCGGKGKKRPAPTPPATGGPQTPHPPHLPSSPPLQCQYVLQSQVVGNRDCSKVFCYTYSFCQSVPGNYTFLFCEAVKNNVDDSYTCPQASLCAAAETIPANPGTAPHLFNNSCDIDISDPEDN